MKGCGGCEWLRAVGLAEEEQKEVRENQVIKRLS